MPNDNTHTGKQYAERDVLALDEAGGYYFRHVSAMTSEGLHAKSDIAAELAWRDAEIDRLKGILSRTPADPKAGDWEDEIASAFEDYFSCHTFDEFTSPSDVGTYIAGRLRALSSAAPRITDKKSAFVESGFSYLSEIADGSICSDRSCIRCRIADILFEVEGSHSSAPLSGITEEMVERVAVELLESYGKWVPDYRHAIADMKESVLALLRQQGPQRSEDQQGAERKWISVDERLPKLGTPIFIRWGDEKASPDTSDLKHERVADSRMIDHMKNGKVGWWCERRVFVDPPPPFTPTQTEE